MGWVHERALWGQAIAASLRSLEENLSRLVVDVNSDVDELHIGDSAAYIFGLTVVNASVLIVVCKIAWKIDGCFASAQKACKC